MGRAIRKSEAEELLSVKVGTSTCLDRRDERKGRRRSGFYHYEMNAYLTPEQSSLLGCGRKKTRNVYVKRKGDLRSEEAAFSEDLSRQICKAGILAGLIAQGGQQTFRERSHAFVEVRSRNPNHSSVSSYRNLLFYTDQTIGDVALDDMTVEDVEGCLEAIPALSLKRAQEVYEERLRLRREGPNSSRAKYKEELPPPKAAGPDLQNKARVFIASVFNDAIERGLTDNNPARARTLKVNYPRSAPRIDPYTLSEIARLRTAITELPLGPRKVFFWTLLATGMRPEEALGLQFRDLDLAEEAECQLHINRTFTRSGCVGGGKTKAALRTISIDADTAGLYREWEADRRAFARASGIRYSERWWVCSDDGQSPALYDTLKKFWYSFVRQVDVPKKGMYQLRHTWASVALNAGLSVKEVSRDMGHSSVGMTLDTYVGFVRDQRLNVAEAVMRSIDNASEGHVQADTCQKNDQ